MLSEDMGENIRMYYAWASSHDPADITFPHQTPVRELRGGGIGSEGLSDDEALQIDYALCLLKEDDPGAMTLIRLYHRDRRSFRWLERRHFGKRKDLSRQLSEAHVAIRSYITCQKKMGAHPPNVAHG